MNKILIIFSLVLLYSCNNNNDNSSPDGADKSKQDYAKGSFGDDLGFLKKYHKDLRAPGWR